MDAYEIPETRAEARELAEVRDRASFLARTRKAVAGGVAGLATTGIGSAISAALSDGAVTGSEVWGIAALALGGFFVGFGTVYAAPANA